MKAYNRLNRLPEYLVAIVLATIPFYAFLTVWASSFVGHYTLLRLWPEVLMLVCAVCLVASGAHRNLWRDLHKQRLAWPMAAFALLTTLYFLYSLFTGVGLRAAGYGLIVDVRPVVWFVVVYATVRRSAWLRHNLRNILLVPLALVVAFAILQFFVLPPDFLTHFGYDKATTITPIQTINQDTTTIRAQSFLRGPNPLGAYLLLGVGLLYISKLRRSYKLVGVFLTVLALLLSSSRSAWLGLIVAAVAWFAARTGMVRHARRVLVVMLVMLLILALGAVQLRTNEGLKNAVLHVNDNSTAVQTSNEDRLAALKSGADDVLHEPLGRGVGTAGPASVYNQAGDSRNSENYFLSLGQEMGWLGTGLFIVICYRLARVLYEKKDELSLMLFATLAGLTLVNLLSYAWADATLVYLWWGLAGLALAPGKGTKHEL